MAFGLAAIVGLKFTIVAFLYFVLTISYCFYLKKALILDGMSIASGFVLRVVGGAVAVSVLPSHWLIVCTFLLALFLAFAKRRQELLTLSTNASAHREVLDNYTVPYLERVNIILIGATIVCYALYTVAPETVQRFETDALIYGTVFVIYGMLRYLALIDMPENGGNPTKLLLRDRPLIAAVVGWAIYNTSIIYFTGIRNSVATIFGS
jgi:4-hydroxybenzoate polyprenyltransferase